MSTEPKLEYRDEQPYAAIRKQVSMQEMGSVLPPLSAEVLAWLERKGVALAGPPFFRYLVVDMERQLDMEVGWPVAHAVSGDDRICTGVLPAGRYAVLVHTGHPDELGNVTAALLAWAEDNGIVWKTSHGGARWDGRLEFYLTDPAEEPDLHKWETQLAFLVAD